jgi:hypothetical protein
MNVVSPLRRASALLAVACAPVLAAGCSSNPAERPATQVVAIPAPPPGSTAWQVIANGGELKQGATVADPNPWITVGPDGNITATIPASEQTKAAQPGLKSESLGALTIRRSP